jgi:hypothetical protein
MDKKSEQTHEGFLIDLQAFLRLCADKLDASLRY